MENGPDHFGPVVHAARHYVIGGALLHVRILVVTSVNNFIIGPTVAGPGHFDSIVICS